MYIRIKLNKKQETDRITAFFDQLSHYGHEIEVVLNKDDLVDVERPVELSNVALPRNHLNFLDRVVYVEKGGKETELYCRLVNKPGIMRKTHE